MNVLYDLPVYAVYLPYFVDACKISGRYRNNANYLKVMHSNVKAW